MKKSLSAFLLGLFFLLGIVTIQAQNDYRKIAKSKVEKLGKKLELNKEQKEKIFRVYTSMEINYGEEAKAEKKSATWAATKEKLDMSLWKVMEETLTPDQLKKYKDIRMRNMSDEEIKMMKIREKKRKKRALRNR